MRASLRDIAVPRSGALMRASQPDISVLPRSGALMRASQLDISVLPRTVR